MKHDASSFRARLVLMLALFAGLAFVVTSTASAAWPPSSNDKRIVFVGGGNWTSADQNIYSMDPDGTSLTPLVIDSSKSVNPVVANDGRTVVFVSDIDGDDELYKIDMWDCDPEALMVKMTSNSVEDREPAIGPDGTVYYASGAETSPTFIDFPTWEMGDNEPSFDGHRSHHSYNNNKRHIV